MERSRFARIQKALEKISIWFDLNVEDVLESPVEKNV